MGKPYAERYHDFSAGHRVYGHENKCAMAHGHNYRIHFKVEGDKDAIGRVLDYGVIKELLCKWLEDHWDHRMLLWEKDPWVDRMDEAGIAGVVVVPFNPTAENMAEYLVEKIGPQQLKGTGVRLVQVMVEETRKCSSTYIVDEDGPPRTVHISREAAPGK